MGGRWGLDDRRHNMIKASAGIIGSQKLNADGVSLFSAPFRCATIRRIDGHLRWRPLHATKC